MTDRQLQFRVGLFVIAAVMIGVGLTFQFGNLNRYFEPRYVITIEFDDLSGVHAGTPVRQSGIPIGAVRDVSIDRRKRKIIVQVEIQQQFPLSVDAQPQIVQSILGEAHIDFSIGTSVETLAPGDVLQGTMPQNPMAAVQRLETQVTTTLAAFAQTSQEWRNVGQNLNALIETNQGSLDQMVEQAAVALNQLTITMQQAAVTLEQTNRFVADPQMQLAVKESLSALPRLIQQTEQTVVITQKAVNSLGQTMENLRVATVPLAANSDQLTIKLNTSLTQLTTTLSQLETFSTQLNQGDGSLQRLTRDPQLYRNLQLSSASLAALLSNLEPIVRDMQVFSDKVARHPELLGVSGYLKGSSGLKDVPYEGGNATAPSALNNRSSYQPASDISGNPLNTRMKR